MSRLLIALIIITVWFIASAWFGMWFGRFLRPGSNDPEPPQSVPFNQADDK